MFVTHFGNFSENQFGIFKPGDRVLLPGAAYRPEMVVVDVGLTTNLVYCEWFNPGPDHQVHGQWFQPKLLMHCREQVDHNYIRREQCGWE